MSAVVARGLTKTFDGFIALDNLDFEIQENKITGLVGPDGAGKTTLVRILSNLLSFSGDRTYHKSSKFYRLYAPKIWTL